MHVDIYVNTKTGDHIFGVSVSVIYVQVIIDKHQKRWKETLSVHYILGKRQYLINQVHS